MDIVLERLRDSAILGRIAKEAGAPLPKGFLTDVQTGALDATGALRVLLSQTKNAKKLQFLLREEFPGREEKAAFDTLSQPFFEAFSVAKESGDKTKAAVEKGVAAFDSSLAPGGAKRPHLAADSQRVWGAR